MPRKPKPLVEVEPCEKCGERHVTRHGRPSCTGHVSGRAHPDRAGKPCGLQPIAGGKVCTKHGGASPQAKAKAEERVVEAEAERVMRTFGEPVKVDNYADALLDLIERTAGHVAWLRRRVEVTNPDALVWGRTREKIGGDDFGVTREARPNVWLTLYDRWSDKLAKLLIEAVRIGLDERRVALAEKNMDVLAQVIDGILLAFGHNPNDPEVAGVVERQFRLIQGEGGAA